MERISRREFIKRGVLVVGAAVIAPNLLAGCAPEAPNMLERLQEEQLKKIKDRTWGSLTEVLNEGLFSKDSLKVDKLTVIGGSNPKIAKEEIKIEGSLTGNSRQLGVQFSLNFAEGLENTEAGLRMDITDPKTFQSRSIVVGDRMGQKLEISYLTGENAGDVDYPTRAGVVRDPQDMKKRFEDITALLKKTVRIPEDTPFVPEPDFNGLATYVSQGHKIAYALFFSARHIDGKNVTIDLSEGIVGNDEAWRESAHQYRLLASKISFKELLAAALRDLGTNSAVYTGGFRYVKDAPAAEYIRQLGEQYYPNYLVQK